MSRRHEGFKLVGISAAACAACCAIPFIGVLTAGGLATVAGVLIFGVAALVVAAQVVAVVLQGRERRRCEAD